MNRKHGVEKLQAVLSPINLALGYLSGFFFMLMMAITVYEVIVRYVFNAPTIWTLELSSYMMLTATFLAASYTLEKEGHVKVDIVLLRLSPERQRILNIITSILGTVFAAILLWKTGQLASTSHEMHWVSSTPLKIYLFPIYLMMPIGSFLLVVQYISKFILLTFKTKSN